MARYILTFSFENITMKHSSIIPHPGGMSRLLHSVAQRTRAGQRVARGGGARARAARRVRARQDGARQRAARRQDYQRTGI